MSSSIGRGLKLRTSLPKIAKLEMSSSFKMTISLPRRNVFSQGPILVFIMRLRSRGDGSERYKIRFAHFRVKLGQWRRAHPLEKCHKIRLVPIDSQVFHQ